MRKLEIGREGGRGENTQFGGNGRFILRTGSTRAEKEALSKKETLPSQFAHAHNGGRVPLIRPEGEPHIMLNDVLL